MTKTSKQPGSGQPVQGTKSAGHCRPLMLLSLLPATLPSFSSLVTVTRLDSILLIIHPVYVVFIFCFISDEKKLSLGIFVFLKMQIKWNVFTMEHDAHFCNNIFCNHNSIYCKTMYNIINKAVSSTCILSWFHKDSITEFLDEMRFMGILCSVGQFFNQWQKTTDVFIFTGKVYILIYIHLYILM